MASLLVMSHLVEVLALTREKNWNPTSSHNLTSVSPLPEGGPAQRGGMSWVKSQKYNSVDL